jgi:outer membrane receptor for ferrienterochelin and colicins
MKNIYLLLVLPFYLMASEISGTIKDKNTGDPLSFVNVFFEGTDVGTTTNEDGYFSIANLPFNEGMLNASIIGYEPFTKELNLPISSPLKINLEKTLIEMSSIVITGTRTERYLKDVPVTTQVLKGLKLRESGPMDVSHILGEMTGVSTVENQFGTGLELSGFGSEHILVLVDGIELLGRVDGQLDISQIPTDQIERIEVVKGASSALYGSEAMGGIIHIITKKPQKDFSISASGDAGSYGRNNGNISLMGGVGNWQSKIFANIRRYGGNKLNNNSLWENGNEYNKYNSGIRLENTNVLDGIVRLDSKLFFEKQKLEIEGLFEDVSDNLRLTNRLEYEGNRETIKYKTGIEYSHFDHDYERFVLSSGYKKSSDTTIDGLFKTDMTFQIDKTNNLFNGGLGYENETIQSDRITPNSQQSNLLYGFLQNEWQINQKLTFLSGIRLDNHSVFGSYYSPKISLMYKPEPISRIRLSYGKGFKAPTFKEMFFDFYVTYIEGHISGNPDLKPEISNSIILDIERWQTSRYHGRVNIFYNEIRNLIDYVNYGYNEDGISEWKKENIYRAITKGFDIDFTYFLTPKVEFAIGYSYLDAWDVDNKSPIAFKAKHKANSKLRIQFPGDIYFNIRAQYIGARLYGEGGQADRRSVAGWLDEYFQLHTNISIPLIDKLVLRAGVKNLTDVYDFDWGPMPGREWYIGLGFNQNSK